MDKLNATNITDDQISALSREASSAGDLLMVATCQTALADPTEDPSADDPLCTPLAVAVPRARQRCADAINAARAQDDGSHPYDRRCGCDACYAYGSQLLGAR
jgi:hypothetical protein